jgi:hypothetical protein
MLHATSTCCVRCPAKTSTVTLRRSTIRGWSANPTHRLGAPAGPPLEPLLAPRVANTLAGYKLEALRNENRRLLDERRALDLQEAELTAPERLQELARRRNMVVPNSGQVVPLNAVPSGPGDSSVAMNH